VESEGFFTFGRFGFLEKAASGAACYRVALAAEVLGEVFLHLSGGFKGHWVQAFEQFRHKTETVAPDHARGFDSGLVVLKTFFRGEAGHAHVNTGLRRIPLWIGFAHGWVFQRTWIQQHHVNMVMIAAFSRSPDFPEGAPFHGVIMRKLPRKKMRFGETQKEPVDNSQILPEHESIGDAAWGLKKIP
jgi:hypothetical protein